MRDIGLTHDQSSRYQQLAAMPDGALEPRRSDAPAAGGIEAHPNVRALLAAILGELRGLRADLAARKPATAEDHERAWVAALLPAVRMPVFTAKALLTRAERDADLQALVGEFARPHGAMALGRRLARLVGTDVDGRALVRRGTDRGTTVFGVRTSRALNDEALLGVCADFLAESPQPVCHRRKL